MSALVSYTDEEAHAHLLGPDLLDVALHKIADAQQIIHWLPELPADQWADACISAANLLEDAQAALDEEAARVPAIPLGGCDR